MGDSVIHDVTKRRDDGFVNDDFREVSKVVLFRLSRVGVALKLFVMPNQRVQSAPLRFLARTFAER